MHDAGVGRDDLEVVEGVLPPPQELVPLAVALELDPGVEIGGVGPSVEVHLHAVVDHELGGGVGVDPARLPPERPHRIAHRGEVHDGGHAREVLEEHPRRGEHDLGRRLGGRVPVREGLDVGPRDVHAVLVPAKVLEQDLERVRKAREIASHRVEPEHLELASVDGEGRRGAGGSRHRRSPCAVMDEGRRPRSVAMVRVTGGWRARPPRGRPRGGPPRGSGGHGWCGRGLRRSPGTPWRSPPRR